MQVYLSEKRVVISERMTLEAVISQLDHFGHMKDNVVLQNIPDISLFGDRIRKSTSKAISGYDAGAFPQQVLSHLSVLLEVDTSNGFHVIRKSDLASMANQDSIRISPLYSSTASQIGN